MVSEYSEIAYSLHYKTNPRTEGFVWHSDDRETLLRTDDVDTKILIYEDQVKYWFLTYAEKLLKEKHADYVVLQITLSQIEAMEQYSKGEQSKSKSRDFIISGLKRISALDECDEPDEEDLTKFYGSVRCGLFHNGFTKKNVGISRGMKDPVNFRSDVIEINPEKLYGKFKEYFTGYVARLKDKNNIVDRENFEKIWNEYYKK